MPRMGKMRMGMPSPTFPLPDTLCGVYPFHMSVSSVRLAFFTRSAVGRLVISALFSAMAFAPLSQLAFAQAKILHVKMANTAIFSEPSMSSAKIATTQAGDQLESMEEAGKFYKVKTAKGEMGYVLRMNVTDTKPSISSAPPPPPPVKAGKGDAELDDLVGSLGGERVAKLDEGSSSHSIRGKAAAARRAEVINRAEAEGSVAAMEKFTVSAEDVKAFRKEGGLDAPN